MPCPYITIYFVSFVFFVVKILPIQSGVALRLPPHFKISIPPKADKLPEGERDQIS